MEKQMLPKKIEIKGLKHNCTDIAGCLTCASIGSNALHSIASGIIARKDAEIERLNEELGNELEISAEACSSFGQMYDLEAEVARLKGEIELLTEEAQSNVGSIVELKTQLARKMSVRKVRMAVARGYCTKRNEKKTLDTDLCSDISEEIVKAWNEGELYVDSTDN